MERMQYKNYLLPYALGKIKKYLSLLPSYNKYKNIFREGALIFDYTKSIPEDI